MALEFLAILLGLLAAAVLVIRHTARGDDVLHGDFIHPTLDEHPD